MTLTKNDIISILEKYDIGKLCRFEKINLGDSNENYSFETDQGKYFLRIFDKNIKPKKILFESTILLFLNKSAFPYKVPTFIHSVFNKLFVKYDKRYCAVYSYIDGKPKEKLNLNQIKESAKLIAQFHKYMKKFIYNPKISNLPFTDIDKFIVNLKSIKDTKLHKEIKNIILICREIRSVNLNLELKKQYIHGDANFENLLFRNNKLIGIVDFEGVNYDILIRDIAIIFERDYMQKNSLDLKKAKVFLLEYMKYNKLSELEISFIPYIILSELIDNFLWYYGELKKNPKKRSFRELNRYIERINYVHNNMHSINEFLST